MSIIGEMFPGWVQTQIQIRQGLQGRKNRNNQQLNVLSNNNAWLKLGSSVKITDDEIGRRRLTDIGISDPQEFLGTGLAQKAVLFNTIAEYNTDTGYNFRSGIIENNTDLWTNNAIYGLGGTDFGITPPPGLISADIKAKNRGSIREANVKIKAHNKFQFELIELLYLRLGFSMLLEWGWKQYYGRALVPVNPTSDPGGALQEIDVYATSDSTLMERYWFEKSKAPFWEVISEIQKEQIQHQSNYDGFLGKVVNFDWKFQPDGTYDIEIKLITVGDVIESLKVNLPQEVASIGQINQSIQANVTPVSAGLQAANSAIVTNAGDSTLSYNLYSDIMNPDAGKWDGAVAGVKTNYLSLLGLVGDELRAATNTNVAVGSQQQMPVVPSTNQGSNTMKYSFFLTLRELMLKIQRYVLPSINGDKILGVNLSDEQICAIYPYQLSLDPRVAFVKPFFLDKFSYNTQEQYTAGKTAGGTTGTGIINYWSWLGRVNNFGNQDNNCIYGNIMNIYLNYDFVTSLLATETNEKGEIFLFKFLQKICDGINDALGGINNIECVLSDDRKITFIEQNPIPGIEKSAKFKSSFSREPVPFELFGFNPSNEQGVQTSNFVREFGFNTKITPNLASMITIGATAEGTKTKNYDGTAFSKWNEGLKDRFNLDYKPPEQPPLLTVPTSGSASDVDPMTLEQLGQLAKAFDGAQLDKYAGIDVIDEWASPVFGWLMERDQPTTSFGGLTKEGIKDITNCPVTNKKYKNVNWNEYATLVRNQLLDQNNVSVAESQKDDVVNFIAYCANALGGKVNTAPIQSPNYFKFDDGFIAIGKNSFKGWVNTISNKVYETSGTPSNTTGFIPIDLNLTCDGISGIQIYNQLAIRQEFLPPQYPNALKFVISQVNHKIENNDWTTNLHTISTANTKDTVLTAETFKLVEYDLTDADLIYSANLTTGGVFGSAQGIGGITTSGIAGDPRDIINPEKKGKSYYSKAPLVAYFKKLNVQNGINNSIFQYLVNTGEEATGKMRDKCIAYNNNTTTWYLAPAPAAAWARWKADAKASGYNIGITNGYRSTDYQASFGNSGAAAKPGSSPHGWGGAVDVWIKEETSGVLRHQFQNRRDIGKKRFKYHGKTGAMALSDRLTEDWKIVATLGARYGFFNPYRMANNQGDKTLDEAWHFEYWGPAEDLNYISNAANPAEIAV